MPSVTRPAQTSRRERRAAIERSLLQATERLLEESASFTELSVERLTREAGISRSAFYGYFDDKGHLLRRLTERVMRELEDAARTWWDLAERATRDDLRRTIGAILEVYERHEAALGAVVETASYDPEVDAQFRRLMNGFTESAREVVERGRAAGVMRDVPALETAGALTWMVERSAHQLLREGADRERLAEALTGVIWSTLYET